MPAYRVAIRSSAAETIRHLPPEIKRAVKAALRALSESPTAGEPLHAELEGLWKYRVRRFRLIFRLDREKRIIDVLALGARKRVYEELAELLRGSE